MSVTNNATVIEDFEGAGPTYTNIGGGGAAGNNTDIFIAGSQSGGRRADNATAFGFWANPGTTVDISGTGEHAKFYVWMTHYAVITALSLRIGSSTTAYETHTLTVGEYPPLGGWWPVWVEVDSGTDTGTPSFSAIDELAIICSIPDVGGAAYNEILDQIHHSTRPVMTWDGSTGTFASFASTDSSNALGTLVELNGVYFLFANLQIGSSTATTFTDSGVTIVAPEFSHLPTATTWQGIDIDLQNASTVITWTDSVYSAADPTGATRKPDLIVTGTSGSADFSRNRFAGLRLIDFTSGVTMNDGVIADSGQITADGADLDGTTVQDSTVAIDDSAVVWDVATDPDGLLDNMTISKGTNAHHAIEFGTNVPATMTIDGLTTSGFNSSDSQNDSTFYFADTSGTITLNLRNYTGNTSYKSAGCTVDIINEVTLEITVLKDSDGNALQNAQCSIYLLDSPYTELMNEDSLATGIASEGHDYSAVTDIKWRVRKSETTDNPRYYPESGTGQITADGFKQTVRMKENTFI